MDVMILCGGAGTRLRPVTGNNQKVLASVGGKPFLDILLDSLAAFGFQRFILCTGYQKDQIRSHFEQPTYEILFSEEQEPLGTGGAIKNAMTHVLSSSFLVLNGDSICRTDYNRLIEFHNQKGGIMTLVLTKPLQENDYGAVEIDCQGKVIRFREKADAQSGGYINAGIYVMNKDVFHIMPSVTKFSLEYDLMHRIMQLGCYGFVTDGNLIDIGTPVRYSHARTLLS